MAKKKQKKRRVGASKLNPNSNVVKLVAVAAGYFLGDTVNGFINKALPSSVTSPTPTTTGALDLKKYLVPGAQLGLGALLLLKGKPGMIKTLAGGLLAGAGLKRLLSPTGGISGYQSVPVVGARNRRVAGYQSTPVIGAVPAALTGRPGQLEGFRVNGYVPTGSNKPVLGSVGAIDMRSGAMGDGVEVGTSAGYMR